MEEDESPAVSRKKESRAEQAENGHAFSLLGKMLKMLNVLVILKYL